MSRFFVGQPVRVIAVLNSQFSNLVGTEARITGEDATDWQITCLVGVVFCWKDAAGEYLSPILPEGAAPSEFESLRDLLDSLERVLHPSDPVQESRR